MIVLEKDDSQASGHLFHSHLQKSTPDFNTENGFSNHLRREMPTHYLAPMNSLPVIVKDEAFDLWPEKAMYWKRMNTLLVADLHIGKINHFRKSGIPVPRKANDRNIEVLVDLIQKIKPSRVIFLGDLFHSHYNLEWEVFGEITNHFRAVAFELVLGNHDIMSERQYERKGFQVFDELLLEKFIFTHHPLETIAQDHYNIAGHIHPGVTLRGKGRQAMSLPCFYFGAHQGLLPAFGAFTGLAMIQPKKDDQVFVIADEMVMPCNFA